MLGKVLIKLTEIKLIKGIVEPLFHSEIVDGLNEDHPRAYQAIYCSHCNEMLHCSNNECMQSWLEFAYMPLDLCLSCFIELEEQDCHFTGSFE